MVGRDFWVPSKSQPRTANPSSGGIWARARIYRFRLGFPNLRLWLWQLSAVRPVVSTILVVAVVRVIIGDGMVVRGRHDSDPAGSVPIGKPKKMEPFSV